MTHSAPLIDAADLVRDYGTVRAVDGVDLRVDAGEVLGLLGPNGAGKSSTLGMICGTLAPSAGSVHIAGVDLIAAPRQAKRALGYLPETPPLYPEMTVAEYLHFSAGLRGLRGQLRRRAVAGAIERCNLGAMRQRLIARLSKGYRQRTGIAQAILHDPVAIVLDEPTVGLDPIQIREIRELIAGLASDHAVILSTHILPEVQAVCSHVQIMHRGRIAWRAALTGDADGQAGSCLRVGLADGAPLPDTLPGVRSREPLGGGRYRLHLTPGADPTPDVARALVEAGCALHELVAEERSLEQIFVEVTAADNPAAAPPDAETQGGRAA